MIARTLALLALAAAPAALPAQEVAVVVTVPIPASVPRAAIPAEFDKAAPMYAKLPGLKRKYFTLGATTFGGVYLWESRAAAEAWFSPAWRARAKATYGVEPTVTWFDAPLVIEGATR